MAHVRHNDAPFFSLLPLILFFCSYTDASQKEKGFQVTEEKYSCWRGFVSSLSGCALPALHDGAADSLPGVYQPSKRRRCPSNPDLVTRPLKIAPVLNETAMSEPASTSSIQSEVEEPCDVTACCQAAGSLSRIQLSLEEVRDDG